RASGAYLKRVTIAGNSVDTAFRVTGPASLDLTVSDKGGSLQGVVADHDNPVGGTRVIAVPEEKYRKMRERYGVGSTDQHGKFLLRGLPPGTYTVFAWQDLDGETYMNADFLKSQEANGVSVTLDEGAARQLELKLSAISEDWQ